MADVKKETAELLPCPFCGGAAEVANIPNFVGVECRDCGADIGYNPNSYPQDQRGPDAGIADAIAAWNRRVSHNADAQEVGEWATPAAEWLEEAAKYFERRPTDGEDAAFWANYTNKQFCKGLAARLRALNPRKETVGVSRGLHNGKVVDVLGQPVSPVQPVVTVGVKPLEWEKGMHWAQARCPAVGLLQVTHQDEAWDWRIEAGLCRARCDTMEEAIAEVEEERMARILAALSPQSGGAE